MDVAVAQWRPVPGEPDRNRQDARGVIDDAASQGADLVVLPELFTVGYFAFEDWDDAAEPLEGPTVAMAADAATDHDVAVLAGSFIEDLALTDSFETPAESGLANTGVLVDADGSLATVYRKRHLFGYASEEADRLVAGERLGIASVGDHSVGITTCYDLRFPGLYREYLQAGVTLMAVPSAWPTARGEHWRLLCRTRAMENQWFLAAANGCGEVAGTELLGDSMIVDPWGAPVTALEDGPGIGVGATPRATVDEERESFPVLKDRREPITSRW